jgi:hypothetical protein
MEFHLMLYANRTATLCVLALLAVITAPSMTRADVSVDGAWNAFTWNNGPGVFQNETPFTFTSATAVKLDVTDAFAQGDRFEVYDHGSLIGTTAQINNPGNFALNADMAWGMPNFSKGTFSLGAGDHSLTFKTIQVADGAPSGTAYFRLNPDVVLAEVPEPTSLALLALGGVALAFRRVRRRLGLAGEEPQPAV